MMNEHEIEEALRLFDQEDIPNLAHAAESLYRLMRWTNANSDGFMYWQKPHKAATRLMELLHANMYAARFGYYQGTATPLRDATDAELTAALKPIKAFLTRQGVAHDAVIV